MADSANLNTILAELVPAVQQAVMGIIKAGDSGVIGKIKEAATAMDFVKQAGEKYKHNEVITGIIAAVTGGAGQDLAKNFHLESFDIHTALNSLGNLSGTLNSLGPVGDEVKHFIVELVEKIASAAGGGLFGGGAKMSEAETKFVADLKGKLGVS